MMKLNELKAALEASKVFDMTVIRTDWVDAQGYP